MTGHIPCGRIVGATPDGRKKGQPLSDNVSPVWGRDLKGPTAILKSVAKLDHPQGYGQILNMTLNPSLFKNEESIARLVGFIKAWLDLDIWHIQFNVISAETLKHAQKHPEKYPNLLVRVAGFSAYFTDLSKELQDNIIQRTEYLL
jgi:formate C-acetyltransferase